MPLDGMKGLGDDAKGARKKGLARRCRSGQCGRGLGARAEEGEPACGGR
jgi:hypothetical protein